MAPKNGQEICQEELIIMSSYSWLRGNTSESQPATAMDIKRLVEYVEKLFSTLGIDSEFGKHFSERVEDKNYTLEELTKIFKEEYNNHGQKIEEIPVEANAILSEMESEINIPFLLEWNGRNQKLNLIINESFKSFMDKTLHPERYKIIAKKFHEWLASNENKAYVDGHGLRSCAFEFLRIYNHGIDINNLSATYKEMYGNRALKEYKISKPTPNETLGYKRSEMPQVDPAHYEEFLSYLKENNVALQPVTVSINQLKATQNEFNDKKILKKMQEGNVGKVVIVSNDNYVIDGHHKWLAELNAGKNSLNVYKSNTNATEFMEIMKQFPKVSYKDISEDLKIQAEEIYKVNLTRKELGMDPLEISDKELQEAVGAITKQNTTKDVKPGETQRQARKLNMNIDRNGSPPLLHKKLNNNQVVEWVMDELEMLIEDMATPNHNSRINESQRHKNTVNRRAARFVNPKAQSRLDIDTERRAAVDRERSDTLRRMDPQHKHEIKIARKRLDRRLDGYNDDIENDDDDNANVTRAERRRIKDKVNRMQRSERKSDRNRFHQNRLSQEFDQFDQSDYNDEHMDMTDHFRNNNSKGFHEDATAGATDSGAVSGGNLPFPLFGPKNVSRRSVDPMGYFSPKKKKKSSKKKKKSKK